jgi:CelD/BcsL family acetyltransferase involved in cellulose biosynthesis
MRNRWRRFQEAGGKFRLIRDFPADEVVAIFTQLFEKRWNYPSPNKEILPTIFQELHDMLGGYVLLVGDRPVAFDICYKHETPRWILVTGVQRAYDPEFLDYSPGAILFFRNLETFEEEASASNKTLRYSLGLNDTDYKGWLGFEVPVYRLSRSAPRKT